MNEKGKIMIAHTSLPALPDGVDILNQEPFCPDADGNNAYRLVWSLPAEVPDNLANLDIRLVATQLADGSFVTENTDDHEAPTIYVGGDHYTTTDARALAQALTDAADLADQWTSRPGSVDAAMTAAHRAVRTAYTLLRTAPGNSGDYLRAARDSLCDATEAIR